VLGVSPALGRSITEDDDRAGAKIVVLTNGLWSRAFGRDPAIVGRTISLDREPYTVVGVMPEHFTFPLQGAKTNAEPAALYVPMSFSARERRNFGDMYNNGTVARLRPGASIEQARGELGSLTAVLAERYPAVMRGLAQQLTLPISPFAEEVVGGSRRMLLVLMGAVGIVLLIGCADVANLMLTRAGSRQRELAIRSALGASPARVVRQLLTEGFVLAAIGGAAGLLLAYWTLQALLAFAGNTLPRVESIGFDRRVLAFGVALTLLTPIIFGVAPALRAALRSTFDALKDGGRSATPGQARQRLVGTLVVGQFALALMLSVGAGLLLRSFVHLLKTDPGFRADHVVTAAVTLPAGHYVTGAQVKQFYRQAVDAARAIPGVIYSAAGNDRALYIRKRRTFTADATARPIPTLGRVIAVTWTSGEFFQTMGIPLKRGRFFTEADGLNGAFAAVISEMMARRLWPDQDAVGRQIKWGGEASRAPWMTVVGVVGDVKQGALNTEIIPQAYEPLTQVGDGDAGGTIIGQFRTVNLMMRTDRDTDAAVGTLRSTLRRLDPSLPVPTRNSSATSSPNR
jgi:putative ABC transport system permease protein